MNLWKISTLGLTAALAVVVGKDMTPSAQAATLHEGTLDQASTVAFEWAREQPHMEKALGDLQAARKSLEAAAEHKGGWRAAALGHVDAAIADTNNGIAYAKSHPKE